MPRHSGFAAVAKDGALTALTDFDGVIYLIDKSGQALLREQAIEPQKEQPTYRVGPPDGVGVWISENGSTAAFGFKNLLVIAKGKTFKRVAVTGLASGGVSPDGSLVVIGLENGDVKAFGSDGEAKWTHKMGGVAPFVAPIGENKTLVATSDGVLILLDAAGNELRKSNVAEAADREKHPLLPAPNFQHLAARGTTAARAHSPTPKRNWPPNKSPPGSRRANPGMPSA